MKVKGRWTYLYRAVDSRGQTIDFLLSAKRDAEGDRRTIGSCSVLELNDVALAVIFGDCIAFKYRQAAASLRSGPKPESKNTQDILLVVF